MLSRRIAEGLGNALVAPVIAYVPEGGYAPPTSHMRFPGTITVPDDVFERTLESAAHSFKIHGFVNIVFLGDHGGYQDDVGWLTCVDGEDHGLRYSERSLIMNDSEAERTPLCAALVASLP